MFGCKRIAGRQVDIGSLCVNGEHVEHRFGVGESEVEVIMVVISFVIFRVSNERAEPAASGMRRALPRAHHRWCMRAHLGQSLRKSLAQARASAWFARARKAQRDARVPGGTVRRRAGVALKRRLPLSLLIAATGPLPG